MESVHVCESNHLFSDNDAGVGVDRMFEVDRVLEVVDGRKWGHERRPDVL
jgi:hypothetical protein